MDVATHSDVMDRHVMMGQAYEWVGAEARSSVRTRQSHQDVRPGLRWIARLLGSGSIDVMLDEDQWSTFLWRIASVEFAAGDTSYLLFWTDAVANDWGEWLQYPEEAFDRLNELTRAVRADDMIIPLDRWHSAWMLKR